MSKRLRFESIDPPGPEEENKPDRPAMSESIHQRRLAALQSEIHALEAENVAPKPWTLLGEASARARPHDALLAHDLEFDRTARAVPVVTEAVVVALEERIKARIREGRFDDVERRHAPGDIAAASAAYLPSRTVQLQDTKSAQSLAQLYEGAYVAAQSGTPLDDRDGRLQREHEAITRTWEGICAKLDALCNAHYVPKPPKASITTISDLPAASLESALPSTRSLASMLAPEEVLTPTSTADVRARSELTPVEKRARRSKERKAKKRLRDTLAKAKAKAGAKPKRKVSAKEEKEAALKSLVKSGKGVTVVGKEGKTQRTGKLAKRVKKDK